MGKKVFEVADQSDTRRVYREQVKPENCFIVISKQEYRLYVYEKVGKDTLLVAHYPVCLSKVKGNKQRVGDMKTPECTPQKPFYISQIQPASSWKHDFKDGRGSLPAYGAWFMRLVTPGHSGIGIHGSTSNESSVPGRDSEGCIRLRDNDIKHLKEHYARVRTRVIIQSDAKGPNRGPYAFEKKAWKAAKDFQLPTKGYTLLKGASFVK
ncbi:MAG: L,D-transpeptidase [Prevotella sp.]|nr:L,D-transpeptidase [Prevotella sp.]